MSPIDYGLVALAYFFALLVGVALAHAVYYGARYAARRFIYPDRESRD